MTDRYGRAFIVTWNGGEQGGVVSVVDGDGRGITFQYANNVLVGLTDPYGRTHTITQTMVNGQWRPTAVTVLGHGSPRQTLTWSFAWTGDLITGLTEPHGRVLGIEYEPVNPDRLLNGDRGREGDARLLQRPDDVGLAHVSAAAHRQPDRLTPAGTATPSASAASTWRASSTTAPAPGCTSPGTPTTT